MSTKQIIVRALLILLVIGILVSGGYALYRFGYAQGVRDSVQFELGGRFGPGFHRGDARDFYFWSWGRRGGFSPLRAIPGLLFTLGFLALIVVAIVSLIRVIQPRRGNYPGPAAAGEPPPPVA